MREGEGGSEREGEGGGEKAGGEEMMHTVLCCGACDMCMCAVGVCAMGAMGQPQEPSTREKLKRRRLHCFAVAMAPAREEQGRITAGRRRERSRGTPHMGKRKSGQTCAEDAQEKEEGPGRRASTSRRLFLVTGLLLEG